MAESAGFKPAPASSDHIAAAPRADEPSADGQASRPRSAGGLLRPSQVPLPGETARRTGSPSPAGGQPHHGLQRLRPSGAPAGAALPLARPSAVPARPVQDVLRGPGQPLAAPLREEMQARLGADFSDVRVHTDDAARASAAGAGARAYTFGTHVVIGDGDAGKHTLAHELTHVIQQRQGPVAGTDNGTGLTISDPADRFEREAEATALRVMSGPLPAEAISTEATATAHAAQRASRQVQRIDTRTTTGSLPAGPWENEVVWDGPDYGLARPALAGVAAGTDSGGTSVRVVLGPGIRAPQHLGHGSSPADNACTVVPALEAASPGLGPWHKGHLLNQELGGPGVPDNLTPMTQATNANFNRGFEQPVKAMLEACGRAARSTPGSAHWFGVELSVSRSAALMPVIPPAYDVADHFDHTATYMKKDKSTGAVSPATGAEIAAAGTPFPAPIP